MPPAPPRSGRRWAIRIAVLVGIAGALFGASRLLPKKAILVRTVRPAVGIVRDVVSSSAAGEVSPELHATVRAEVAARVIAVLHKSGARVQKGEVVVKLDTADLDARLSQAQASISASASQVAQTEARIETLNRQAERARTLLARGAGTAQLSEDAEAAVREATQAMRASRGQLEQTRAALQVARVARAHGEITAPFAGLLTDVYPNLGEALAPAAPVLQIIDDQRLHVDATIDEADAAKVRVGQEAELKLDALPDQAIKGRVSKVDPSIKRDLKGSRTLGVEVEVQDVDRARAQGLKPGMSANVDIVVAEKDKVLYLPTNVIVGRGLSRSVYVLRPEGRYFRATRTVVQVGVSNWERTEVSSGVSEGELIVASLNVKGLDDGALCEVERQKEEKKAAP